MEVILCGLVIIILVNVGSIFICFKDFVIICILLLDIFSVIVLFFLFLFKFDCYCIIKNWWIVIVEGNNVVVF